MINKSIDKKSEKDKVEKKPNESAGLYFSSHIKIFDPNTKEVFVQKRADT
jgi:hypothetical protein